jgi:hypothetical protein
MIELSAKLFKSLGNVEDLKANIAAYEWIRINGILELFKNLLQIFSL